MKIFRYLILFIIVLLLMGKVTITALSLEMSDGGISMEYATPCDWSEEPIEEDDSVEGDDEALTVAHPLLSGGMVNLFHYTAPVPGLQTSLREVRVPPPQV